MDNVVCNLPNYRQFVIFKFPNLKMLDYQKVSQAERDEANALFSNKGNLEQIIQCEKAVEMASAVHKDDRQLSLEIKKQLAKYDQMLEEAQSMEEI